MNSHVLGHLGVLQCGCLQFCRCFVQAPAFLDLFAVLQDLVPSSQLVCSLNDTQKGFLCGVSFDCLFCIGCILSPIRVRGRVDGRIGIRASLKCRWRGYRARRLVLSTLFAHGFGFRECVLKYCADTTRYSNCVSKPGKLHLDI